MKKKYIHVYLIQKYIKDILSKCLFLHQLHTIRYKCTNIYIYIYKYIYSIYIVYVHILYVLIIVPWLKWGDNGGNLPIVYIDILMFFS